MVSYLAAQQCNRSLAHRPFTSAQPGHAAILQARLHAVRCKTSQGSTHQRQHTVAAAAAGSAGAPPSEADVVVVGAGLAGLNAARTLRKAGLNPVVLEASDDVGGRVRTDNVDGFLLDRGFQIYLTGVYINTFTCWAMGTWQGVLRVSIGSAPSGVLMQDNARCVCAGFQRRASCRVLPTVLDPPASHGWPGQRQWHPVLKFIGSLSRPATCVCHPAVCSRLS
jgi:hypothetical protein